MRAFEISFKHLRFGSSVDGISAVVLYTAPTRRKFCVKGGAAPEEAVGAEGTPCEKFVDPGRRTGNLGSDGIGVKGTDAAPVPSAWERSSRGGAEVSPA